VIEHTYHQNANTELKEDKFNILMLCDTYEVNFFNGIVENIKFRVYKVSKNPY